VSHDEGAQCRCVAFHRPKPTELHRHHIWPRSEGGPDTAANIVWVCPTTHTNVHEYLRELRRFGGVLPVGLANEYPRYTRRLAELGWRRILAGAMVD